jgi:hypothetical protein
MVSRYESSHAEEKSSFEDSTPILHAKISAWLHWEDYIARMGDDQKEVGISSEHHHAAGHGYTLGLIFA